MAVGIITVMILGAIVLIFVGPKVTPYSRKQWALLMATLIVLWIAMGYYLIFVVGSSEHVNPQQVAGVGALNLLIGVPLFISIARK